MERQVFKRGFTIIVLTLLFVTIAVGIIYNTTQNALVFLVLLAFVIYSVVAMRNKLVIEHGVMYFQRLMFSKEIPLEEVSQISLERIDTMERDEEKSSERYVVVYDNNGKFIFKFPFTYVAGRDKQRFIDTVHASNPETHIELETNHHNLNVLINDYKQYKKDKKGEKL